ncbi:MAG: aldose epimerase family protein [Bacillota bacterium]
MNLAITTFFAGALLLAAVSEAKERPGITCKSFGKTPAGEEVFIYRLNNSNGMIAEITNYGGIVIRLTAPDKNGKFDDVVLGFNTLEEYIKDNSPYFGAIIGRYSNRIANGQFILNGNTFNLAKNNNPGGIPCSLHGGIKGFDKVLWQAESLFVKNTPGLKLQYLSKDGEEGYPGNLRVTVTYWLTDKNELKIEYNASTDKPTPLNLTNHSYFNLKGEGNGDILDHELVINADKFTPVNKGLIPTGQIGNVKETALDFTSPHKIGERVDADNEQLKLGGGYDHNWVLNRKNDKLSLAASAYEPSSGRFLQVYTTEPGIQFYCGNFLDGSLKGKSGKPYNYRNGFALETQHFPDSPNHPDFPNTILKPGQEFKSSTVYKFTAK